MTMKRGLCHLPESGQEIQGAQFQNTEAPGSTHRGIQAGARSGLTFQTLLSAVADGDEQCLYECISRIEHSVREFSKILESSLPRRTQVLEGLRNCVAIHGQQLAHDQIREYRKSLLGKRAAMIYRS